ncbi:hypothetical protein [Nocardioides sp. CFH 31398]|uniref:hypothetical protein n=1 Tax=Nocardioides sp. CFH 31398 TaxID=2919579 RepID=UPI001F05060C|nr:hypothetical protein [Nocardioides sp. CFH 31398]MCH1867234.1 hypothetical protein [Nocardioides sp. CFH 31398]
MGDVVVAVVGEGPDVAALADALADAVPGVRLPHPAGRDLPTDLSGLDGVLVGPDALGSDVVAVALAAGLAVLCARPVADAADAHRLVETDRAAGGGLVRTSFPRRHDPRLRELRRHAQEGDLGRPRLLRGVETGTDVDLGLLHAVDTVAWLSGRPVTDLRVESGDDVHLLTIGTQDGPVADVELRLAAADAEHAPAAQWEVLGSDGSAEVAVSAAHLAEAQRILLTAWVRSLGAPVPAGVGGAGGSAEDALAAAAALSATRTPQPPGVG